MILRPHAKVTMTSEFHSLRLGSRTDLWYQGGDTVGVYDFDWKPVATLPVTPQNYAIDGGFSEFRIENASDGLQPWLDVQFLAKGDPF